MENAQKIIIKLKEDYDARNPKDILKKSEKIELLEIVERFTSPNLYELFYKVRRVSDGVCFDIPEKNIIIC